MLNILKKDYFIYIILILFLFITRIISFRETILNIDELEYLYSIRKSLDHPLPFFGFDNHTTGPFAIYFLAFFKLITGFSKLYQFRLVSFFFFILPSFFFVYQITQKFGKILGILAFTLFLSVKKSSIIGNMIEDTYCYNTEYQILFFSSILFWILRLKNGFKYYTLYTIIIFILPFVKFQSIPLVLFFGGYLILKLMKDKQLKMMSILIAFYLFLNTIWLLFLFFKGIFPEFYHAYISKNLNYMSNSNFGGEKINPLNFINTLSEYYDFVFIFICIFVYVVISHFEQILKRKNWDLIFQPIVQSFLFLLTTSFLLVLSKNNFGHYYIFIFLPASIFISDLYAFIIEIIKPIDLRHNKTIYAIFTIILLLNFNFDFFYKSISLVQYKLDKKSINQYSIGIPLINLADENLTNWLRKNKGKNESLLVLGWFEAQAIYYVLQNDFRLHSRSSHSFYIQDSFRKKNETYFKKEEQIFLEDMQAEKPQFIVDTWNLLTEIKGTKIPQFVSKNYVLKVSASKYQIYQRID